MNLAPPADVVTGWWREDYERGADEALDDDAPEVLCAWFDEHSLEIDRCHKTKSGGFTPT